MAAYSKVIIGISGSIAAYKAAFLTRLFIKKNAEVQVLMTHAATGFIAPLTLSTLSKRPVFTDVQSGESWNNHVELGLWADALLIAPASANTLAKMAHGLCDNALTAVYLSARCPVFVAPAMDVDMWQHPATQQNIRTLQAQGVHVIPVGYGDLASGLTGEGRMAEPEAIVEFLDKFFNREKKLSGKKALVTAGPTHEPLDPVRFIGNHSTGKMGIALAEALAAQGAEVNLVLGPTGLRPSSDGLVQVHAVESAREMYEACTRHFEEADIVVLAAAVADYRPVDYAPSKIKKNADDMNLPLTKTVDIAATLGKIKKPGQVFAGFALETDRETENAREKLLRKNFDFIVLNSLRDPGAGFGFDTNKISILRADGSSTSFDLKSKTEVAADIVEEIVRTANRKQ